MEAGDFFGGVGREGREANKDRKNKMKLGKPLYLNMCPKILFILLKDNYKL